MIKSWEKFNEEKNTLYFEESDEFEEVLDKYAITDEDIKDFFIDLEDERNIETKLMRCSITDIKKNSFGLITILSFDKPYLNQKRNKRNHIQSGDYLKFLSEQVEDIKSIQESCKHFGEIEHLNIIFNEVSQEPFQGAGANMEEYGHLRLSVCFEKIIETSEMSEANTKFQNKENPFKKAIDKIAKELIKAGVKKEHASKLLDIHPGYEDMEDIYVGFLTDDEIIVIAYINKTFTDITYLEEEFARAVVDYENGLCVDRLLNL